MNTTLPAPRGPQRATAVPRDRTAEDTASTGWALAARTGDREAADAFVRALHRDVVRYVAHLSADPQSAEDLAQDTFLRALRTLHRFEGRSSARTWLLTIARRAVVDDFRRAAARPCSPTPTTGVRVSNAPNRLGCPASRTGWRYRSSWPRFPTTAARRSCSPSCSGSPMRRPPM